MNEPVYKPRPGLRLRTSAQAVGSQIEALREASGGELTPEVVVADARQPTSPLHREFNWNDQDCAEQFRLHRARGLINGIVRVVIREAPQGGKDEVHVLQSVRVTIVKDAGDGGKDRHSAYVTPEAAFSREDWTQQVRDDCNRQIAMLENRLRLIGQTEQVIQHLARAREELARAAEAAEQQRQQGRKEGKGKTRGGRRRPAAALA